MAAVPRDLRAENDAGRLGTGAPSCVVLAGPPGAGKGTQADAIARAIGARHCSTGDALRDEIRRGSGLGARIQSFVAEGRLVPDDLVLEVVLVHWRALPGAGVLVLDGFPRTLAQARDLIAAVGAESLRAVVELAVPTTVVLERLAARLVCTRCGAASLPEDTLVCSRCHGPLEVRPDDHEEAIRRRLVVYETETRPMLRWFAQLGLRVVIDGARPIEDVLQNVLETALETDAPPLRR
jgi:adenylate kinase